MNILSQDEINALINSFQNGELNLDSEEKEEEILTDEEKDILGEIGNISMGKAATTLSELIGNIKTSITTPRVSIIPYRDIVKNIEGENIAVKIQYTQGISGNSILILSEKNSNIIANLMLGQLENFTQYDSEILKSAVGEAMNQMVGTSSIAISNLINTTIDISPPEIVMYNKNTSPYPFHTIFREEELIVKIDFDLEIEGYINSVIMLVFDIKSAKDIVKRVRNQQFENIDKINVELNNKIIELSNEITEIYLPIFNMFGFNFVKCEEFKYITSIVQVETELLNKLNITSINQKEYNAYIFSNGLIEKIKQIVGFFNEDAVNDFITELNNNLLNGILTKYNKNTNIFDTISIGQYLNLKNEEYVLLKFTIDDVDFFQIFNLNLLNLEEYSNINLKTNEIKLEEYYQEDETTSNIKLKILCKIPLKIEVLLDKKNVTIKDLLYFNVGKTIELSKEIGDLVEVYINGIKFSDAELMQAENDDIDNRYAIKITNIGKEKKIWQKF